MKYGDIIHYTGWDRHSNHSAAVYVAPARPSRFSGDLILIFTPRYGVDEKLNTMWAPCIEGECPNYGIRQTEGDTE